MQAQFHSIWEGIADAVPDQDAVVQGERRVSWRDYDQRAARLAQALLDAGLRPQAKVGMYLYNSPEYCETNFAALKIRCVPINVSYRYLEDELRYLLENADVEALVFHRSLADRVAAVCESLPQLRLLIEVDDEGSDAPPRIATAVRYDDIQASTPAAERIEPHGDELYMFYTGGTTGMPKGVMYPFVDFTRYFLQIYPPMVGLAPIDDPSELPRTAQRLHAEGAPLVAMSAPPLMHGTGCWVGLMTPHLLGGTAVLLQNRGLDPLEVWEAVARERVQHLIIVGDAFAKPMTRILDDQPDRWDLSCLRMIISSGAMFSTEVKQRLIDHIPDLAIADVLGSTEGGMGQSIMTKSSSAATTALFALSPTTKVLMEDGREVQPGSGEVGMVANGGLVPIGYYKDPEKSARTFREINGVRYSFPGDMATIDAEGKLVLFGRGSNCINTGGEKVFPEEVEEALKVHPDVEDALVFGIPDDRFGQRVVGIASLVPGGRARGAEIVADARRRLASYKLPRHVVVVERVPRAPNGKADYRTARELFAGQTAAPPFTIRVATQDDRPRLVEVMNASIAQLQRGFISAEQIESSKAIMGLDSQLVDDGTYFVVECDGEVAGCGGWSRRATLYGGDHSAGRDAAMLDPAKDAARVRAMYTNPRFARRGVGRMILRQCEIAAGAEGFTALELAATMSGLPLYESAGYKEFERTEDASGGVPVPLVRMRKPIPPP